MIFWDWNGTIIDDLQVSMDSVNALLAARSLNTFKTPDEYHKVFCFPVIDYYKKAGFDFSKESFETLAKQYVFNYNSICRKCSVFPDIIEVLETMKAKGEKQVILTASEKGDLTQWLKSIDVMKYFDDVIANDNIYAVGKENIALNWLAAHKEVDINDCIFIGDTTHDFNVATAMGCKCVLVARGHNSFADLASTGAAVCADGRELLRFLLKE